MGEELELGHLVDEAAEVGDVAGGALPDAGVDGGGAWEGERHSLRLGLGFWEMAAELLGFWSDEGEREGGMKCSKGSVGPCILIGG